MTDETTEPTIDPEHPWVIASQVMNPQPTPAAVSLEPVVIQYTDNETGEAVESKAALLGIVDATGVKTVYLEPDLLHQVLLQGSGIMKMWIEEQQQQARGKLVVATPGMEKDVIQEQKIHETLREGRPNLKGI